MGKQKQKKRSTRRLRTNPLGVREKTQLTSNDEAAPSTDQIIPVIQRLSSSDDNERIWAAASLSNLAALDEETRKILYTKNIVPLLLERLSDPHPAVVEESLGTLRNLVSMDPAVAKEFYAKDILRHMAPLIPKISSTIHNVLTDAPCKEHTEMDRRQAVWDMAENFIYIIWAVCEASGRFVAAVQRMHLLEFLVSFFASSNQCPVRVVIAAGQCLLTLTDDNKEIYIEFQNKPEYVERLQSVLRGPSPSADQRLVIVLACAILFNLRDVQILRSSWVDDRDSLGELSKQLLPVFVSAIDIDIQQIAQEVIQSSTNGTVSREIHNQLVAVQLALEILSDICAEDGTDEDGWKEMDMEGGDDDSESLNGDDEQETTEPESNEAKLLNDEHLADANAQSQSDPILQIFAQNVLPILTKLATPTPLGTAATVAELAEAQTILVIHLRALECFNNFLLAVNELPFKFWFKTHHADATQAWTWLFNTANTFGTMGSMDAGRRDGILDIIVGCLWSLGRGLGQAIPATSQDVSTLMSAYSTSRSSSMRVKIIGCLGPVAMRQGQVEVNKDIGLFVLSALEEAVGDDTRPDEIIEALNFMYDVYSDAAFDYDEPIFVHLKFLDRLRSLVAPIRRLTKSIDRRKSFDRRLRADEALSNLNAFIKYKAQERM